jgi:hypothetical protein
LDSRPRAKSHDGKKPRAIHGGVSLLLLLLLLLVVEPNILHVVVRESTPWSPSDF